MQHIDKVDTSNFLDISFQARLCHNGTNQPKVLGLSLTVVRKVQFPDRCPTIDKMMYVKTYSSSNRVWLVWVAHKARGLWPCASLIKRG